MTAEQAASFHHHLHGLNIGGTSISIEVDLPPGTSLPTVSRSGRKRNRTQRSASWLPHLDEVGRYSATPRSIALHHGRLLESAGNPVLDPFCGAGGNAIAAAMAGCTVFASDTSEERIRLAQKNAVHFNVGHRITFSVRDVESSITDHDLRRVSLFCDPPWGGVDWDRQGMTMNALFGGWPDLVLALSTVPFALLKLPRTFLCESLDPTGRDWDWELGIETMEDHPAERVRLLTAQSRQI